MSDDLELTRQDKEFLKRDDCHTYTDIVDEARKLVLKMKLFKLKIAKLAIKACTIRHGGRSGNLYTLDRFAEDVGVSGKQLSSWVLTYKRVVVLVEDEIVTDNDWNTAQKVNEIVAKENTRLKKADGLRGSKTPLYIPTRDEVKELIEKVRSSNTHLIDARANLGRAYFSITQVGSIDNFDFGCLLDISEKLESIIGVADAIQKAVTRLMEAKKGA